MKTWICAFLFLLNSSLAADTVYCIHGFLRKPSSMKKIGKAYAKNKYNVELWGYQSYLKTIQELADDLVADLCKTAEKRPGEPIHFVAHSLGGIITRCAHNHPDFPEEAKKGKVVLLAPPNQGSKFGQLLAENVKVLRKVAGRKAGRQLILSKNFEYVGQFSEDKNILIISGIGGWNPAIEEENDDTLGVSETCLDTPHDHSVFGAKHNLIVYHKDVIKEALRFIDAS